MKVLLVTRKYDFTSLGYQYEIALKKVGIDATMLAWRHHKYQYPDQCGLFSDIEELNKLAEKADILHIMHTRAPRGLKFNPAKVVVSHTGTPYKKRPEFWDSYYKGATIISGLITGALWVGVPIDLSFISPDYNQKESELVVGHYPSGKKKGTEYLISMMKDFDVQFKCSTQIVPWTEQIERMSNCDIYIEDGLEYPSGRMVPGVTAFEAAALGKICIAPFRDLEFNGLVCSNSLNETREKIEYLLTLSDDELYQLKLKARAMVEKNHSFEAVGRRLAKIYEEHLSHNRY